MMLAARRVIKYAHQALGNETFAEIICHMTSQIEFPLLYDSFGLSLLRLLKKKTKQIRNQVELLN